jgi:pimeloyl-ACP methyl ester carboxylesterase
MGGREPAARLAQFHRNHPYRTVGVHGTAWRYLRGGSGGEVVLVPSGGARRPETYVELIEALERHFTVVAVAYPVVPSMDALADGLVGVLDAEGVSRAHIVASSFGGYVAQVLMQRHPARVGRVVLANTGTGAASTVPTTGALIRLLDLLPAGAVRRITSWNWRRMMGPDDPDSLLWAALDQILAESSKQDLICALRNVADFSGRPAAPDGGIAWPPGLLIIESARDRAFPPQARAALRAAHPGAHVRTFDAGHDVSSTHSSAYIAAVLDFLQQPATG